MGCCNQRRSASIGAPSLGADDRQGPRAIQRAVEVRLRYVGGSRVRVRGTATGRTYVCSSADRLLMVDRRDVAVLIRSGHFAAA